MTAPPQPLAGAPRIGDWVGVADDGAITIRTGRVELGQGSLTALRQIAADELDCDPSALTICAARTDRTPDEGFTAGSLSVTVGGAALRWAASALREALLFEAARRLGCGAAELGLRDGAVLRAGEQTDLDLSALAPRVDLDQRVVDLARPTPPGQRWRRGRDAPRLDLRDRLVGAPFLHDLDMPGMLHGRVVHPPAMTAALESVDLDALRARPGVSGVVRDGSFLGVLASSPYDADRAARWARSQARWSQPAPAPGDHLRAIAGSDEPATIVHAAGDVASVAGQSFETEVLRPYLLHASIGPSAAIALWLEEVVTVWTHSQGVFQLREALGMALDLPEERFVVIHHPGAGCYGHNGADDAALDAVLLSRAVPGRPVKVVWSRVDEFRAGPIGPGMATRVQAMLDGDTRIAAMRVTVNSAPHANRPGRNGTPNLLAAAELASPVPPARSTDMPLARGGGADRNAVPDYDIPNVEVRKRLVHALPYRTSSLRGLGAFANVYAIETLMDDIASALGEDPAGFRLRHLRDPRACAVIEAVCHDRDGSGAATGQEASGWGLGFARYKNTSGYCAVAARVEVDESVRVTHVRAVADIGEVVSPDGARNQIEGGILQSVSWATREQVAFVDGAVGAQTWLDYPILRFSEIPQVSVRLIERMAEPPLGAGEIAQGPTVAAIGNAVHAALGVRVRRLPIDREAVLAAMM